MKIILKASEIPIGSFVTKIKGNKQYKIVDKITIFGEDTQTIKSEDNSRFLINDSNISCVSHDYELVWNVDPSTLFVFIQLILNEES